MKGLLISAALFLLPSLVGAQVVTPRVVTDVEQTFRSTMTCVSVSIASATAAGGAATQVVSSTQTLWGSITIQNKDSSANAYFSDSINVASGTANGVTNALTGFEIAAGSPGGVASFYLAPGMLWYGVNDSGARATTVTICKGR